VDETCDVLGEYDAIYVIWVERQLENIGVNDRITLKWILENQSICDIL
jgi:hypothetical protein